jgi:hypothetical protein
MTLPDKMPPHQQPLSVAGHSGRHVESLKPSYSSDDHFQDGVVHNNKIITTYE